MRPAAWTLGGFVLLAGVQALTGIPKVPEFAARASGESAWIHPVDTEISTGYQEEGPLWASGHHTGVDYAVPTGTLVVAASQGIVAEVSEGGPYGLQVVLKHPGGLYSQYAHLSSVSVSPGQDVDPGESIALSGNTGNSTGPHLHFEIRTCPNHGCDIDPGERLNR